MRRSYRNEGEYNAKYIIVVFKNILNLKKTLKLFDRKLMQQPDIIKAKNPYALFYDLKTLKLK